MNLSWSSSLGVLLFVVATATIVMVSNIAKTESNHIRSLRKHSPAAFRFLMEDSEDQCQYMEDGEGTALVEQPPIQYTIDILIETTNDISLCTPDEESAISKTMEDTIKGLDLLEEPGIIDLDPHICKHSVPVNQEGGTRSLSLLSALSAVQILFIGEGTCNFCGPDNDDRRRERRQQRELQFSGLKPRCSDVDLIGTCGCITTLDFSTGGDGNALTIDPNDPYLDRNEYKDLYGLRIRARGRGAIKGRPRVYDTTSSDNLGLASPNSACVGGAGPGVGSGGEPTLSGGATNPGANCDGPQGNVLFMPEDKDTNTHEDYAGSIVFSFKEPVTLKRIGLMDIEEHGAFVQVWHKNCRGRPSVYRPTGYGTNSLEMIDLNLMDVKKFLVNFSRRSGGAIRFVEFCNDPSKICANSASVGDGTIELASVTSNSFSYNSLGGSSYTGSYTLSNAADGTSTYSSSATFSNADGFVRTSSFSQSSSGMDPSSAEYFNSYIIPIANDMISQSVTWQLMADYVYGDDTDSCLYMGDQQPMGNLQAIATLRPGAAPSANGESQSVCGKV